jgi:hypothetical protein
LDRGQWLEKPRSADCFHCPPSEGNFLHRIALVYEDPPSPFILRDGLKPPVDFQGGEGLPIVERSGLKSPP